MRGVLTLSLTWPRNAFCREGPGEIRFTHTELQPEDSFIVRFTWERYADFQELAEQAVRFLQNDGAVYWLVNNMMVFTKPK